MTTCAGLPAHVTVYVVARRSAAEPPVDSPTATMGKGASRAPTIRLRPDLSCAMKAMSWSGMSSEDEKVRVEVSLPSLDLENSSFESPKKSMSTDSTDTVGIIPALAIRRMGRGRSEHFTYAILLSPEIKKLSLSSISVTTVTMVTCVTILKIKG